MQPIDGYPFVTSKEEIRMILEHRGIDYIKFKKGEIIADIGAGNGYIEAMLSIYYDSLTFYIQDIDTTVCNQKTVDEVVKFYEEVNGKPFTNKFIVVNGTDTETNLPDSTFDKILMLSTYQYLKEPKKFILDVREKLKDDGLFYVINTQSDDYEYLNTIRQKYGWNASPLEQEISDIIDCGFELKRIYRNYQGSEQPYTMVFKKDLQ
ncbi:MAG: class I SAM-dependent methyltransferase [Bacteroidales bacterium]